MAKPNLPVVIFLQVLVTQVIAWVGKSFLQDVAFNAYSKFVLGANAKKQRELRKQVLADKAELQKTSSQDEFAKWARLKRKVDKGLEQLEKESECWIITRRRLRRCGRVGLSAQRYGKQCGQMLGQAGTTQCAALHQILMRLARSNRGSVGCHRLPTRPEELSLMIWRRSLVGSGRRLKKRMDAALILAVRMGGRGHFIPDRLSPRASCAAQNVVFPWRMRRIAP